MCLICNLNSGYDGNNKKQAHNLIMEINNAAFVEECIKIISSRLRIPLLHFYPHKINIISYL